MSDKTESQAEEIVANIETEFSGDGWPEEHLVRAEVVKVVTSLLADQAAFRQMVAAELAALLAPYADELDIEPIEPLGLSPAEWKGYNASIRALATRLGIEL